MLPQSPASKFSVIDLGNGYGRVEGDDYSIQGSQATDIEWRVARALDILDIPYIFQYEMFGGRVIRGGLVVDFLAITVPLSTPIDVRGEYWHGPTKKYEDDLEIALMRHYNRGQIAEPVILWGSELQTDDQALSTVRRELRV